MSFPIVRVRWSDAWCDFREHDSSRWEDNYDFTTYGLLVRFMGPVVSIASEKLVGEESYRSVTHVPSEIVREIEVLGWADV